MVRQFCLRFEIAQVCFHYALRWLWVIESVLIGIYLLTHDNLLMAYFTRVISFVVVPFAVSRR